MSWRRWLHRMLRPRQALWQWRRGQYWSRWADTFWPDLPDAGPFDRATYWVEEPDGYLPPPHRQTTTTFRALRRRYQIYRTVFGAIYAKRKGGQ